jgi:hypothetical protein
MKRTAISGSPTAKIAASIQLKGLRTAWMTYCHGVSPSSSFSFSPHLLLAGDLVVGIDYLHSI